VRAFVKAVSPKPLTAQAFQGRNGQKTMVQRIGTGERHGEMAAKAPDGGSGIHKILCEI